MTTANSAQAVLAIALALLAAAGCQGESVADPEPVVHQDLPDIETFSHGADAGRGNLLGLQAWVQTTDYASAEDFDAALRPWFEDARDLLLLRPDTIVVLPEYIGAWLVALNESAAVYSAESTTQAMAMVAAHDMDRFNELKAGAPADDSDTYAIFALKSELMAAAYQQVFAGLAQDFATTIVAGSILLPNPVIEDGTIVVHPGEALYNVSFVFGPDGSLLGPPVLKAYPTEAEQGFLTAAEPSDLPVFDTAAGRLAVLVCADSWFAESYEALAGRGVEIVAVPVYVSPDGVWDEPWQGGNPKVEDADPADVGTLTEGEAWCRYSLPGRITSAGDAVGMTVPLRGDLWDLGDDGHSLIAAGGECVDVPEVDAPMLINLWL